MCGIAGICNLTPRRPVQTAQLEKMIASLRHRGPDEFGLYLDDHTGLAHARLSIIDLAGGTQPMHNEDKSIWIVFNGEIFNYKELRPELIELGHRFHTSSDTEVIIHAYEQYGPECLRLFNGQFAFALWDCRKKTLFLARDRVGIRPLHYTVCDNVFYFASEIKSLFTVPQIPRRIDHLAMEEIFTFWTPLPGRTAFENISELPAGHCMLIEHGRVKISKYWQIPFAPPSQNSTQPIEELTEQTNELLHDSIRLRLRADVPVGCYLSGGLDSSGIAARVVRDFDSRVNTFGIRFQDPNFDEGDHQQLMVRRLGVNHTEMLASNNLIGQSFADVVFACEKPLLRTGPVPLFLLSRKVRDAGLKVVLTGEGADEFFGGYNIFRETKARQCWARQPQSQRRAAMVAQLYPYIFTDPRLKNSLKAFFGKNLENPRDPFFSHIIRWENTRRTRMFFSEDTNRRIGDYDACAALREHLPRDFQSWHYFSRAIDLESRLFMTNYLLSSQGDRVAMANSVEIRMPFLDYRLIEFLATVPSRWKILGLSEKYLLKKVFADALPDEILNRPKHPYRAPIVSTLLKTNIQAHLDALDESAIKRTNLFDAKKVSLLVKKLNAAAAPTEVDSMALAGVLSTQLLYELFIAKPQEPSYKPRFSVLVDNRSANKKIGDEK